MSSLFYCDDSWEEELEKEKERQREILRDNRIINRQPPSFQEAPNIAESQKNEVILPQQSMPDAGLVPTQIQAAELSLASLAAKQQNPVPKANPKQSEEDAPAEALQKRKLTQQEVEMFRKQNNISVYSNTVAPPAPVVRFHDSGFPPHILNVIGRLNYEKPTPIQAQAWPVALQGVDLIGIAETGTGKTLAFLLPGIVHILKKRKFYNSNPEGNFGFGAYGASILVLAPTRELVLQIFQNIKPFIENTSIKASVLYGGVPKQPQIYCLRMKPDIIVATPGRLIDLHEMGEAALDNVTYFVMDEADRMLDMGFEFQVREIISYLKQERQTLMWSATWPPEVQRLAKQYSRYQSVYVKIGSTELKANMNITQRVEIVEEYMKLRRILQILQLIYDSASKILIFCHTKKRVDKLNRTLNSEGWVSLAIHGDKTQHERDMTMSRFKSGTSNILIATNVASRGLDVKDIKFVINYDFPAQIEEYVHRIGRTARGGSKGVSITFFSQSDSKYADDLIDILEESEQKVPPQLASMSRGKRKKNSSFGNYKYFNNQKENDYEDNDAFYETFHNFGEEGEDYDEDYENCEEAPAQDFSVNPGQSFNSGFSSFSCNQSNIGNQYNIPQASKTLNNPSSLPQTTNVWPVSTQNFQAPSQIQAPAQIQAASQGLNSFSSFKSSIGFSQQASSSISNNILSDNQKFTATGPLSQTNQTNFDDLLKRQNNAVPAVNMVPQTAVNNLSRNNFSDILSNAALSSSTNNFSDKLLSNNNENFGGFSANALQPAVPSPFQAQGNSLAQSAPVLINHQQHVQEAKPLNPAAESKSVKVSTEQAEPVQAIKFKAAEYLDQYFDQEFLKMQLLAFQENLKKWELMKASGVAFTNGEKKVATAEPEESGFDSNRKSLNSTGFEEDLNLSGKIISEKTPKQNCESDKKDIIINLFDSENKITSRLFCNNE